MKILDRLEEYFVTLLMFSATLIIFVAVMHRYLSGLAIPGFQDFILSINLSWAQELCIILFVWMAKFGAAYGVRTGIHVGIDVIVNLLNDKWRKTSVIFSLLAGAFFTGIIAALGGYFVWENGLHQALYSFLSWDVSGLPVGPTTPDLEWPTWAVYSAIPLGSALMCFRFLQVLYAFLRHGIVPVHNHSHVGGIDDNTNPPTLHPQGR